MQSDKDRDKNNTNFTSENEQSEDPDIAIIKARKMKELQEKAAALTKKQQVQNMPDSEADKKILLNYLYDRADEVLHLAQSLYPTQTHIIIKRLADLIRQGEIQNKLSGGDLLALFRSLGLNIRINTTIKVEDRGKMISLSDKLRKDNDPDKLQDK